MKKELTVFFDYNCPFCYLESIRLQGLAGKGIAVNWRSYQKPENANPPAKPTDYGDQVQAYLKQLRDEKGMEIQSPPAKASTILAHIGGKYALEKGKFTEYQSQVFNAIWQDGQTVDSVEVLVSIARRLGWDEVDFRAALENSHYQQLVEKNLQEVRERRIWTIPYYIAEDNKIEIFHFKEIPSWDQLEGLFS